ncbi:DUF429 domain-containing protein [Litchfieldella rifensis]|uniref:DUF429 domain-containing protein n=1 Tax=Litchfieldella rifensis TaxID=762643 RepID=A0ABV7LJH1_9GAMM
MKVNLIGVDCATAPNNVGLALGSYSDGRTVVEAACLGTPTALPEDIVTEWVRRDQDNPTLIALDAPLGWPAPLADALQCHRAGQNISTPAHDLFRRRTDRKVRETIGKQSLDVGADRIARTAYAALKLLENLRQRLNETIPLAWDRDISGLKAIEVYPAATLAAHGIDATGYRAKNGRSERERVIAKVSLIMDIDTDIPALDTRSDGLDAVICLLALHDFLSHSVLLPPEEALVEREGWIWVRDPFAD